MVGHKAGAGRRGKLFVTLECEANFGRQALAGNVHRADARTRGERRAQPKPVCAGHKDEGVGRTGELLRCDKAEEPDKREKH